MENNDFQKILIERASSRLSKLELESVPSAPEEEVKEVAKKKKGKQHIPKDEEDFPENSKEKEDDDVADENAE